jgi:hypothetical protein
MTNATKFAVAFLVFWCFGGSLNAVELKVSAHEPIVVEAPEGWTAAPYKAPDKTLPAETYRVVPPAGRNAECLISIHANHLAASDPESLKSLLRMGSRPYVKSWKEAQEIECKPMKMNEGTGFYANFVDPDMVDKPVEAGHYKTATPIVLVLASGKPINITLFCDEIGGADYRELIKIAESIKARSE